MAIFISGKNGYYIGNDESLAEKTCSVEELVNRYNNKAERKKLKKEIRKSSEVYRVHMTSFALIDTVYGLTPEQEKCFKFIKFWGKKK